MAKAKVGFYWCASCGGCEEAIVDLDVDLLPLLDHLELVFWPIALDFKYSDVEAMEDGEIDVCFINGAIRSEEQEHIAKLLRQKSKVVIAFGACSAMGGIPGLMNFSTGLNMMNEVYKDGRIVNNPSGITPVKESESNGCKLTLPGLYNNVYALDQIIDVEYYIPGCSPHKNIIVNAVTAILEGNLPPVGSVLSPNTTVCSECRLKDTKPQKLAIKEFKRTATHNIDPDVCHLAQGFVCMGPATRAGCEGLCINSNNPCEGCYGPTDNVKDQGAKFLSAVASIIDSDDEEEIKKIISTIDDPAGYFYRFSLPSSLVKGREGM